MSNPRGRTSAEWKRLVQEVDRRDVSGGEEKRRRSESRIRAGRSLRGGRSHDHMFKELLKLLTQKLAPRTTERR